MIETDLTCFCDLAIGISDEHGIVQACSAKNAERLGIGIGDMIGRNWRDFTSADEIGRLEPLGARALAGARLTTPFVARRDDGGVALSRATMMGFRGLRGAPRVLVLHQAIHVTAHRPAALGRLDLARCIEDVGRGLVATAEFHHFDVLARILAEAMEQIGVSPSPEARQGRG